MNAISILSASFVNLSEAPVNVVLLAMLTVFLTLAWALLPAIAGRIPRWRVARRRAISLGIGLILASLVTLVAGTRAHSAESGGQETAKTTRKPSPVRHHSGPYERTRSTVTISGRALDNTGRPVADAVIQVVDNNSMISDDRVLGKTNSGADGRYILREISIPVLTPPQSAIPKPTESRFEVSGWAPGKAFTWHKTQSYRPEPRPAKPDAKDSGQVFFEGETIIADLVFGPSARLNGTVTDDTGKPVSGALVQVGYINDVRRPEGSGTWYCAAIDPQQAEDLAFNGIASVPASLRSAHTDDLGRYVIDGLPREAKLLTLIDFKPSYSEHSLTIATSKEQFQGVLSVGHEGILNHTFVVPRTVRVRAILAASGKPAAAVTVTAEGTKMQRGGSVAKTDADGMAVLQLQPDNYTLRIEPPTDADAVVSKQPFTVTNEPSERSVDVKVDPAAVVIFEATVAATGEPVAGIGFEYETDTTRVRKPVHSQTVFVDHPVTGPDGRLRVVMTAGTRRFFPILTRGIEFVSVENSLVAPVPGKPIIARFAFRKAAILRGPEQQPPKDELIAQLNERWKSQRDLIRHGRARATRYYQSSDGIDPGQLTKLLDSLDPDRVPAIFDLIRKEFPEAEPASPLAFLVTVDEPRRREEWPAPHPAVRVFNGRESIAYSAENAQVDVTDNSGKSTLGIAIEGIESSVYLESTGGAITERANGKVTIEKKTDTFSSRRVVDAATGFVYRDSFRYHNGSSATEHWQFAPRSTPQGLVIPGMSIVLHTYGDRTNPIWIRTIESIDLTTPIAPESFVVSVPAGTMILDYREGRDDSYRGMLRAQVTDVVTQADEIAATRKRFVPPVKAGDRAPAIDATVWLNQSGKTDPPKLEGKVVLVEFWGITCGPCVGQLPEVREAVEHFAGTDLVIIGLHDSSGTLKELAEFAAKRGITYQLAIDRESKESGWFGVTFAAYGIRGIPSAAVLDRDGKVAFVGDFREAIEKAAALLKKD